ncbi:MAG: hypothetical protein FWD55_07895, partial [Propionibacteriaceae bacterium]|nr:hypothetical protein [Propionibacteriaceae bacterium]
MAQDFDIGALQGGLEQNLRTAHGSAFDLCCYLFSEIREADPEHQPVLFHFVAENFGFVPSDKSWDVPYSEYNQNKADLKSDYAQLVDTILEATIKQNREEGDFYNSLWASIIGTPSFDTEGKRAFAFYYMLIDASIPYFHIDRDSLWRMDNVEFQSLRRKHVQDLRKTSFLLKRTFQQRTEKASALLAQININPPDRALDDEEYTVELEEYQRCILIMD